MKLPVFSPLAVLAVLARGALCLIISTKSFPSITTATPPSRCGGFTNPPPTCPPGQFCVHPPSLNPDLPGYCVGQSCGGFTTHPLTCPAGQVCVHTNKIPDLPGICLLKEMDCGGITGKQCWSGWHCVTNWSNGCEYGTDPDCLGICVPNP
jgi:hypothetical protein